MDNTRTIMEWQSINPSLNISVQNDFLVVGNRLIPLNGLKLEEIYNGSFKDNIANMSADELAEVVRLNAIQNKAKEENLSAEEQMDTIKENSASIQNIGMVTVKGKEYVYFTDEKGNNHVLYKYAPTDILRVYNELLSETRDLRNITEKDLFARLESRMQNLELHDSKNVKSLGTDKISERTMNNFDTLEKGRSGSRTRVEGNVEHDLYVVDGGLTTLDVGEKGELHKVTNATSSFDSEVAMTTTTSAVENTPDIPEQEVEEPIEEYITALISEEKYYRLINSPEELSGENKTEIAHFNSYIGDLFLYEEILNIQLKEILSRYLVEINKIAELQEITEINKNQTSALNKYAELSSKKPEATNRMAKEEVMKLVLRKPEQYDRAGYIKNLFIGLVTTISILFLGIIAAILVINK